MTPTSVFDSETKIRIYCERVFETQAQYVLSLLKNIFNEGGIFDSVKVKFGLALFIIKNIKDEFVVTEPDLPVIPLNLIP